MSDDYDIACLRATFEDWTREKHGWTRFKRDENGYKSHNVQTAWYWLRLGFVTGQRITENALEGSDNQTDHLNKQILRLEEDLAHQKELVKAGERRYARAMELYEAALQRN